MDGFPAHLVAPGNILEADEAHVGKAEIRRPKIE
jgi:hypothetical protein